MAGYILIGWFYVAPEKLLAFGARRVSLVAAVFEKAMGLGLDLGILLFFWNFSGALATFSFIYTASWIDPRHLSQRPRLVRNALSGKGRMKILFSTVGSRV